MHASRRRAGRGQRIAGRLLAVREGTSALSVLLGGEGLIGAIERRLERGIGIGHRLRPDRVDQEARGLGIERERALDEGRAREDDDAAIAAQALESPTTARLATASRFGFKPASIEADASTATPDRPRA
jgi:hypothetical protein